jgi:hypothetical protein
MARMMIAFVGAYILGRMKKFKLAIAWFGLMTGYKLKLSPEQLLEQSSRVVEASPQLQQLVAAARTTARGCEAGGHLRGHHPAHRARRPAGAPHRGPRPCTRAAAQHVRERR